jgi:hypothetical protein
MSISSITSKSRTQRLEPYQSDADLVRQRSVELLRRQIVARATRLDARLSLFKRRLVSLMAWLETGGFEPSVVPCSNYLGQLDRLKQPITARGNRLVQVQKVLVEIESTIIASESKQAALEKEFDQIEKWAVAEKGYTHPTNPCAVASRIGRRR